MLPEAVEAAKPAQAAEDALHVPIWRLSVAQYHQMGAAGILTEDDPVELLEGWLVEKMTKNPPHTFSTQMTYRVLDKALPPRWFVYSQEPLTTLTSEPEPDVMIVRGTLEDYAERHPNASEVALVVEVSDATLKQDRTLKQRIYAAGGIPTYWLLNLIDRQLEVYTQPTSAGYQQRQDYALDHSAPVLLDGVAVGQVSISALFPPAHSEK